MAAWTWFEAGLRIGKLRPMWRLLARHYGWKLMKLLATLAMAAWLLLVLVTAARSQGYPGDNGRQDRIIDRIADHEARLMENERYHGNLDSMRVGERLASLEAKTETIRDLMFPIAGALFLLLIKEIPGFILSMRPSVPSKTRVHADT